MIMSKIRCLQMDLDEFWSNNESIYTEYDIGSFRRKVVIKPNYKERNCSDCMDFRSKQEFTEINGYYFCGLGSPFACEMFKVDSQTC